MACYFAMKKAQEKGSGRPVILGIYATKGLVGREVSAGIKVSREEKRLGTLLKQRLMDLRRFRSITCLKIV